MDCEQLERNLETVRAMYQYGAAGDWDALQSILTDDFELIEAESFPFGGTYRGKGGLRKGYEVVLGALAPRDVRVKSMTANEQEVVAMVDIVLEEDGEEFIMPVAEYFQLRDGLIARIVPYFYDSARINAYLSRR